MLTEKQAWETIKQKLVNDEIQFLCNWIKWNNKIPEEIQTKMMKKNYELQRILLQKKNKARKQNWDRAFSYKSSWSPSKNSFL